MSKRLTTEQYYKLNVAPTLPVEAEKYCRLPIFQKAMLFFSAKIYNLTQLFN